MRPEADNILQRMNIKFFVYKSITVILFFVANTFKKLRPCIFSVTFKNQLAFRFITKFENPLYTRLLYSYLICGLILNLVSLLRPKSFLFRVESI